MNSSMKRLFPTLLAGIAMSSLSAQALADRGDLSAALKVGKTQASDFTLPNGTRLEPDGDNALGVSIGYEIDANWTAEFQLIKTDARDDKVGAGNLPINIDETSMGLFGVYRTPSTLGSHYFFGKVGYTKSDTEVTQGQASVDVSESGLSYGAGVGYQYSPTLALEAEYYVDSDIFSYIMVSAKLSLDQ